MLRITSVLAHPGIVRLILEGEVSGDWVRVLEQQCSEFLMGDNTVVLDFESVTFVDREGIHMLRRTASPRLKIEECTPLIQNLLKQP